jgi:hypothetical protein
MAELPIDCGDTRDISREGYVYVIDPPLDSGGRRDEWQGWLEVSLVTRPFQDDAVLDRFRQQAFDEWGARWRTRTELEAPARFWFDGDVLRVDQTTRLRDGSTLVVLGERISESTIAGLPSGWFAASDRSRPTPIPIPTTASSPATVARPTAAVDFVSVTAFIASTPSARDTEPGEHAGPACPVAA